MQNNQSTAAGRSSRFLSGRGFTLIEMLLVLTILSVVIGVAVVNFNSTYSSFMGQQVAADLSSLMRYAQAKAVSERKTYQLVFDQEFSGFRLMRQSERSTSGQLAFVPLTGRFGRVVTIPDSVSVSCPLNAIHFYPDGNIEKTNIELVSGETTTMISTALQKGAVRVWETES